MIHHLKKENRSEKNIMTVNYIIQNAQEGACSLYFYETGYKPRNNLPLGVMPDTS